jgi:hypothetical protein
MKKNFRKKKGRDSNNFLFLLRKKIFEKMDITEQLQHNFLSFSFSGTKSPECEKEILEKANSIPFPSIFSEDQGKKRGSFQLSSLFNERINLRKRKRKNQR